MGEKYVLGNVQISMYIKYWYKQLKNLKRKGYKEFVYFGVFVSFFFIFLYSFVVQEQLSGFLKLFFLVIVVIVKYLNMF